MYVKQVIITGFKSYKEQTVIEPFSPKHNVIVGRNGSGKSNFFAAIRFVLGDEYTQMGREERQALLHEGKGSAVMSAYVEIIFDNSDDRFPTGKPELILRRTIGMKKDEYSIDRRNATKSDVMNLLESAGFSRSNPYYIVPQGRVTRLTNMKDSERLDLLKDVAGTKVYEARKAESQKIMNETNNKRKDIDLKMEDINIRMRDLERDQEELRSFQEKDRERRCLEYSLHSREQQEISKALDEIEYKRQSGVDDTDDSRTQLLESRHALERIDIQINELKQQMDFLRLDKKQLEQERREHAKARAQVELNVKTLADGQLKAHSAKQQQDAELLRIRGIIQQRENELAKILPAYEEQMKEENDAKLQLSEKETALQRLYAKQGRNARFKGKKERDDWLREQINDTYASLSTVKAVRMQTAEDVKGLEKEIKALESEQKHIQEQIDGRGGDLSDLDNQNLKMREKRDDLVDKRKGLWREEAKLDSVIGNAKSELGRAERSLSHMMDGNTSRGIAAVRRIKEQHNLQGCYGTLAELIEVSSFVTPVEVTAGNSLFHYVVDTDDTASKIMEILNKERAGRVTFMPLNRLRPQSPAFPQAQDAVPLISKIKYDRKYERAVQQVFGKTILCPNLTVAAQYARSHNVTAITPEGDRSDKKGALTGGFFDRGSSRMEAVGKVSKWREEYEAKKANLIEIQQTLQKLDQTVTKSVSELQKLEQQKAQAQANHVQLRQELKSKVDMLHNKKDHLDAKIRQEAKISANVKALSDQQSAHEAELSTDFKKALTTDEERELENLSTIVQDLKRQYATISASRSEVETKKSLVEVELNENLRPVLEQLEAQQFESADTGSNNLQSQQRELKRMTELLKKTEAKSVAAENELESSNTAINTLESDKIAQTQLIADLSATIARHQRRMEKSAQKKSALQAQAKVCADSIRELGVLPEEAFTKYKNTDSNAIVKKLHKVNDSLKKYTKLNKKAFEHYRDFTKQRETLTERRKELDTAQDSIQELIEVLDQRKDEAIERTFKQVSKEFATVFGKLVPAGHGRLIIQRKTDQQTARNDEDEEDDDQANKEAVENYTGVGISVSFNSKHDDQQRIQQLSGGQKSLCALTLIFAIQACDPAPFYLFDEIDANLDAQYRTAVAEHLKSLSEKADDSDEGGSGQFICTTFRPEMLRVAQKCYGVEFGDKTSHIRVATRDEALKFVEGEKQ